MNSAQPLQNVSLFEVGQIRLAELSVYNWGSFDGLHTATIDPYGTLVTGDNGAGKSTLIDGLMALLLPAGKASFNIAAAQGDRTDRSLVSYMRGTFGSVHDGASTRVKSKREAGVVTALRAHYVDDRGSVITLAAVFWLANVGNAVSDIKRIYLVARKPLKLKPLLDAFGNGQSRVLKQWLKQDGIICCDDNFSEYQALYRKHLFMDNKNAPALLSRALGLKKIDDLTQLIRELVLEPSNVKEDAKKVVVEFADLVATHDQLLDARAQQACLDKLPQFKQAMEEAQTTIVELTEEREGLRTYFGRLAARLWGEKLIEFEGLQATKAAQLDACKTRETDAQDLVERRHGDFLKLGGDRIEQLEKDLATAKVDLSKATASSSRYQETARTLGLETQLSKVCFDDNQSAVAAQMALVEDDEHSAQDQFAEIGGQLSRCQNDKKVLQQQIDEIAARPDSNIDIRYQQLRDEMVSSLGLVQEKCVFIGELIDVNPDHHSWQGGIERALGGLRTTLAVPQDSYSMVTRWLNARHTGLHVRVQVVNEHNKKMPTFMNDGFLRKLQWREHPYREWVKSHLARFDLHCVDSTEQLDVTPYSMTQPGLIHMDKGRFEKKDQYKVADRRFWSLGFSNKSRLELLRGDLQALNLQETDLFAKVKAARQSLNDITKRKALWEKMQGFCWDDINLEYWIDYVRQLEQDLQALTKVGNDVDQAKQLWQAAKVIRMQITTEKELLIGQLTEATTKLTEVQSYLKLAESDAAGELNELVYARLQRRVGAFDMGKLVNIANIRSQNRTDIELVLERQRKKKEAAVNGSVSVMAVFRNHQKWQVIATEWGGKIDSLPSYLEHLQTLEREGLPILVEQFRERLNKHATQSLVRIEQRLLGEKEDIQERIDTINNVLAKTEFRSGSHLKLGMKTEKYPHVQAFAKNMKTVLAQASSDDHELRFRCLQTVVEILDKASSTATANTKESLRLLDPRYQMSFYAEEKDNITDEVKDVLASSSGKSGGEKESFAGTIVAAALAYVLTPDGHHHPVYCTVFLDEAFSNTAEAVSRRVLRVFNELHIHVNLITPYKNLNLARESARSLIIAERDQDKHESRLSEVTWAEIDKRILQEQQRKAREVGIELA
jgi:uncharacterized protein YPO0396